MGPKIEMLDATTVVCVMAGYLVVQGISRTNEVLFVGLYFVTNAHATISCNEFKNDAVKITALSSMGKWVNMPYFCCHWLVFGHKINI